MAEMHFTPIKLPKRAKDISGQKLHKLKAVAPIGKNASNGIFWLFLCDCGTEHIARYSNAARGITKSCGCLRYCKTTHGSSHSPEYNAWKAMKSRCYNPSNKSYSDYGGRGIAVCGRWINSFSTFVGDIGIRPSSSHSIDRIDNDSDYSPENCKWATKTEQMNNRRNTVIISINGESKSVSQWARTSNINERTIRKRLAAGWPAEDAVYKSARVTRQRR